MINISRIFLYTHFPPRLSTPQCNAVLDAIPKSKKNKRCLIHSLETQKPRTMSGNWMDVWEALSQECREELVRVEQEGLVETVESYLRKHRFCTECKAKVMKAYHLLIGDEDCNKEKGYCPTLYDGLRSCSGRESGFPQLRILIKCDAVHCGFVIGSLVQSSGSLILALETCNLIFA